MGKIVVSANVTLDGVIQDPDGAEGFTHGGWFKQFVGDDFEGWARHETEETLHAEVMLLGRKSEAWFGTRTPGRSEPWAARMNSLPKYVVSSTLKKPQWTHSTLLTDVVKEVSQLKQTVGGEILIYGSYQLVRMLMEHGLVDEFRLIIFPVVLGAGERLFGETAKTPLRLIRSETLGKGLPLLTYEVAHAGSREVAGN